MAYYFDELIVAELRKGNNLALKELYKTYYPMAVNLVCTNSGTEQEAKDVFQECLIAFHERIHDPTFSLSCKIKTYLYAVCRRLWLKRLSEKKKFSIPINPGESFAALETEVAEIENSEAQMVFIEKSLSSLGEPCRTIIEDFYIQDLSMDAIRDKHGYANAETAKNQKYKCLQRLKKIFFSHYNVTP